MDVNVLMLAVVEVDDLRTAWDVIVLLAGDVIALLAVDVAHEERDMSAASTSQKKPALNSMTAACTKGKS